MFGWIKRKAVDCAAEKLKEEITVDSISAMAVDLAETTIVRATNKVRPEKTAKICRTVREVSEVCGTLAKALEDGVISTDEMQGLIQGIYRCFNQSLLTDEVLHRYIDQKAAQIKERI